MGNRRDRRNERDQHGDNEFGDKRFGDNRFGDKDSGGPFQGVPSSASGPIDEDSIPVNLGAVRADDEFIEALLTQQVVPANNPVDYELAALLSNWRADISATPMPAGPSLDEVEAGISAQRRADSRGRSLRMARYTAGAAAVCAILFGGLSVVAHESSPGDPLWGVKEVMFGADASATMALAGVEDNLDHAIESLASGDKSTATAFLNRAQSQLADVNDADKRAALQAKIDELRGKLVTTPPSTSTTTTSAPPETTLPQTVLPPVTVTATQETVTVLPPPPTSTTSTSPSSTDPTVVSEPPPVTESSSSSSSVPLPPPG
jgi:hypothetical protein